MEENNNVHFPAPLSVGFYGWNDLSCPKLKFTKFLAIKWDPTLKNKSDVWSDQDISNIIFAGTKKGVILTYKITSKGNKLKNIEPLCFLFGHSLPITSLIKCKQSLYDLCVASLSSDGTVSLISVIDLTIIKNSVRLFSENSQDLSIHQTNMRLAIASQTFGTIEIADIYDEKILMRVDGFTSTVYSLISYGNLNAVACIDGSTSVFSVNSKTIECLYSFKRNENPPCFSIFSPQFVFLLVISPKQWSIHISDTPLYSEKLKETDNFYSNGGWVDDSIFFLQKNDGHFQMWCITQPDNEEQFSVIENLRINRSFFNVATRNDTEVLRTLMENKKMSQEDENRLKSRISPPRLVFECGGVRGPIAVTQEGFVISASMFEEAAKAKNEAKSSNSNSKTNTETAQTNENSSNSSSINTNSSNTNSNSLNTNSSNTNSNSSSINANSSNSNSSTINSNSANKESLNEVNSSSDNILNDVSNLNGSDNVGSGGKKHKTRSVVFCMDTFSTKISSDLSSIYTSDVICRCAVGDPITSEARILKDSTVWVNERQIGIHKGAKMLFSPSTSSAFFTFSKDGSVKAFSEDQYITSFYDLSEPISHLQYVDERDWLIVIGKHNSFSVISTRSMQSVALCTGHNSPVMNVSYSNGLLHALCTSAMLYSWNVEGQLVSKRMVKFQKPTSEFGEINGLTYENKKLFSNESAENQITLGNSNENNQASSSSSPKKMKSSTQDQLSSSSSVTASNLAYGKLDFKSLVDEADDENKESFYKISSLVMTNCQTYAIILDVFKFLSVYKNYSSFDVHSNPELLLLVLLWKRHIGSSKVHIDLPKNLSFVLDKLNLTLAGDNFTVTIPINRSIYDIVSTEKVDENDVIGLDDYKYNRKISFYFSPLTTSIHIFASSTLAQCFINKSNNEHLLMLLSLSQTMSTDFIDNCKKMIKPSIPIMASYFLFHSENLEMILLNFLSYIMNTFNEQESLNVLFSIQHLFANWNIIIPFVLFHCQKFSSLPKIFANEVEKHLFPAVLQNQELFVLLKNCFSNFSENINNIDGFFQKIIIECIKNNNKFEPQVVSLATIRPFEFLNSAIEIQNYKQETTSLIIQMVNKLINPDRAILMSMICHAISMQKNGFFVNIEEIFNAIMKNNLFFSFSKSFAACGDVNGYLHMISMESGSNAWATKKVKDDKNGRYSPENDNNNQILYVSFAPSGSRLIFVDSEFDITWISIQLNAKQSAKDKFSIIGSYNMKKAVVASEIVWKSESTVTFLKNQKVVFETSFPKMSFFEKVADKFVSSK